MKEGNRADRILRTFLKWPVFFAVLLIISTAVMWFVSDRAGFVMTIFALIGIIFLIILHLSTNNAITQSLVGFAMEMESVQKDIAKNFDIPFAIVDDNGKMGWCNDAMLALADRPGKDASSITTIFPEIEPQILEDIESLKDMHLQYGDRDFRVRIKREIVDSNVTYVIYAYDETEFNNLKKECEDSQPISGLIYIDNYDEVLENAEEVQRSLLAALVERKLNEYIDEIHGTVKKLEKDKYFFIARKQYLSKLKEDKFSILEDVKTINIGNEMNITLSIGIGLGGSGYDKNYEYARTAIDMALGRGGDQAVIKEGSQITYYGGKSQSQEKITRVKARVKAHALRELMETKDRLIIMGHKNIDIDAFGAAIGIWRIAISLEKNAYIVIGDVTAPVRPVKDKFDNGDYPEDMFISKDRAMELLDSDTILVVVDVNRPMLTEAPELLDRADTIVVLDHHRQSEDVIKQAVLSYAEPYASSTCEMVSEILQYITDDIKIKSVEADAMYAGIVIDTNNFTNQSGVRTFEAAAYLRRNGADVTRVRKMFREKAIDYQAKAEAIRAAKIYKGSFAIAECPSQGLDSPMVIGAQAANELLDIIGIKASIVLSEYNGTIYASARSIDEVNVQVLMEKLGGGGHRTIAGAQFTGMTMEEAEERIKSVIDDMQKEGEI